MQYTPTSKVGQGTVGREIERQSEIRPDQAAVVCTSYAPLSYRELQGLINEIQKELRGAGFSRSARIAVALPSGPHAALAVVAIACSAVAVPLNPQHTLDETEKSFATLRPEAVLLLRGSDSVARRAAERKGLATIEAIPASEGVLGLKVVAPQSSTVAPHDEPDPEAPAFILQTSGTVAEPKLIPFSHRNMLAAAARLQAWFKLTPQDRCLCVSPVYYSHGLKVTVFTPLLTGGTVAFPADPSQFDFAEWFGALRPTWYSAGPTLHRLIFDKAESISDAKTKHSLRFVLSGGAPLPRNILEGLQRTLGVPVVEHYGSSEAAQIAANLPSPGRCKPGTCGMPWPGTVMIVDEDGRQLPPGEQGEILIGGPTLISGYLDAPELNQASFVEGWFKTGDIGSLDEEGFLTLHGRLKDLINRGGEKVSPPEVDAALMRHPAVAEAAAFAVPHERLGEEVAAAVVLKPGIATSPPELRRHVSKQLAAFKVPRLIFVVDQLPKGLTGKVLRRRLSESFGTHLSVSAVPDEDSDQKLLLQLRDLWERLLKSGPLTIDDDFFDKGGDSLLAVEMLCGIEQLTGQTLPSSVLVEASTIRKLAQMLRKGDNLLTKHLIQISSNGNQVPLVFFHGDDNGGSYVRKLASLLGSDQPFFVVAPHDLDSTPDRSSIEAMAADRLPLIVEAQPKGPYRLGGYCIGGLVAFEVARLLIAAGEKVEMVIMLDSPAVNARRSVQIALSILNLVRPFGGSSVELMIARTWFRMVLFILAIENFLKLSPSQRWLKMKTKAQALFAGDGTHRAKKRNSPANPARKPLDDYPRQTSIAMSRYLPQPLSVRVIYFSATYNGFPWRRITSDLEITKLSGDHYAVVRDVTEFGGYLRVLLREKLA